MSNTKKTRARYEWPRISVVHPEHGSYQMDVHALRDPRTGAASLIAYSGVLSYEQGRSVPDMARAMRNELVRITEDDIAQELAVFLAAQFHEYPGNDVVIVPGYLAAEHGLDLRRA